MKNYLIILVLLIGSFTYAQPNEPEFTEVEYRPIEREETALLQQPSFESMMVTAFKAGNAEKIATYFSDNIELSISNKEDLYSQSQAEQILKTFFTNHKPKTFKIIHKGTSGQSEYFIGELESEKKYRVTLNSKAIGGVKRITSLTIEENS